jgi:hypothetical protein
VSRHSPPRDDDGTLSWRSTIDNGNLRNFDAAARHGNHLSRSCVHIAVRCPTLAAIVALAHGGCSTAASSPAPAPVAARAAPASPPPTAPAALATPLGDLENTAAITRVRVVAAVAGGDASERPAYARADQHVTLYAVLETRGAIYTDAPALHLGGRAVTTLPLARGPRVTIAWRRIEPAAASYSNTDDDGTSNFHFTPVEYRATPLLGAGGSLAADVRPTLTPDRGNGVGTMRFQIVVAQGERSIASAGPEARRGRGSGGLTDDVTRVSIRRDDTYLGYLTEMFGQPYIWASAGATDATHESERLEGADCADFVVYGERRLGHKIGYTYTGGLPQLTKLLAAGARGDDGIYRDAHGAPLPFGAPGDLVLFPRHVGVLVEDRGTLGVLDDQDIMMHALFDTPKEQAIADSGYADKPVELRRWPR